MGSRLEQHSCRLQKEAISSLDSNFFSVVFISICSLSLIHFLKDIIGAVPDELFQCLVIGVGTEGRIHQGPDIAVEFDDAVQPTGVGGETLIQA